MTIDPGSFALGIFIGVALALSLVAWATRAYAPYARRAIDEMSIDGQARAGRLTELSLPRPWPMRRRARRAS